MPQERKHENSAGRQAAYRKRCERERIQTLKSKGLPQLPAIPTIPGWPRWKTSLSTARDLVERTVEEMQEYFDERSEEWQESERAVEFQEHIDTVQSMLDEMPEMRF